MRPKQKEFASGGLVTGIIVGVILGFGGLNMLTKSQRTPTMMIISVGIGALLLGIGGYTTGSNMGRQIDIETELGHDDLSEKLVQQGRVWIAITIWTNKKDGEKFTLVTGQTDTKILITQLNDAAIYNHEIKSGSNQNVSKFHKWSRNQIFEEQKRGYEGKKV